MNDTPVRDSITPLASVFAREKSVREPRNLAQGYPERRLIEDPGIARGVGQRRKFRSFQQVPRHRLGEFRPQGVPGLRVEGDAFGKAEDEREPLLPAPGNFRPYSVIEHTDADIVGVDPRGAFTLGDCRENIFIHEGRVVTVMTRFRTRLLSGVEMAIRVARKQLIDVVKKESVTISLEDL